MARTTNGKSSLASCIVHCFGVSSLISARTSFTNCLNSSSKSDATRIKLSPRMKTLVKISTTMPATRITGRSLPIRVKIPRAGVLSRRKKNTASVLDSNITSLRVQLLSFVVLLKLSMLIIRWDIML